MFGCINYGLSTRECGSDIYCFRDRLEMDCEKSILTLNQQYGMIRLESKGPVWTDAVFGKDKRAPSRCEVNIRITEVNESAVPAAQKQQLQSAGISISSITLAEMNCVMTDRDFYKIYYAKDKEVAKTVYGTCSGTLKLLADQVPALQEFMTK
jgi:hypothetical protein